MNSSPDTIGTAFGVDANPEQRPGVPMEAERHRPIGNAHWLTPDRMADPGFIQKRSNLDELTPVFGTAVPPRGISGMMRRAAYRIPDHHTSHWLVLLLADRVDALEHRAIRALPFAAAAAGVAAGIYFTRRPRRRRSRLSRLLRLSR